MDEVFFTDNPLQTKKLGKVLAEEILRNRLDSSGAFVIGLEGNLGSGKTTFLQGFAAGLGIKEKVTSPTFVIMKGFRISGSKFRKFYHIDCYRIQSSEELLDLDFDDIVSDSRNIVAVEWAERVRKILPEKTLLIKFEFIGENERKISLIC